MQALTLTFVTYIISYNKNVVKSFFDFFTNLQFVYIKIFNFFRKTIDFNAYLCYNTIVKFPIIFVEGGKYSA